MNKKQKTRLLHLILSLAIVVHLIAVSLASSSESHFRKSLFVLFRPYIQFFGLSQDFTLFGVVPNASSYVTAVTTFKDGSRVLHQLPRSDQLSPIDKTRKSAWMKWQSHLLNEKYAMGRTDACRWIARLERDSEKVPIKVELVANIIPICKPGAKEPRETIRTIFFAYQVREGDLRNGDI